MDRNAIKDLYVHAFRGTSPDVANFSIKDVKETVREEMKALAPTKLDFQKNKYDIFTILQEAYDEVLPEYANSILGTFAEVKTVPNNTKASFRVKRGRNRAKTFVTQVGLSGTYEAFRLDVDTIDVKANAWGGAAYIDFERSLDGSEDITESLSLLLEGLEQAIQKEIVRALISTVINSSMPTANYAVTSSFDPEEMARLCAIAKNYGGGNAVIFATPEFIQKMGPDAIGMPIYGIGGYNNTTTPPTPIPPVAPGTAGYATPVYAPQDINDIHVLGHITMFRGVPIVEIAQSFTNDENDTYLIPPSFAYIFPAGDQKIVKVVFEGDTQIDEWEHHRDRSMEIEVYKKFGVAILSTNSWCAYRNLELETAQYATYDYLVTKNNPHNFA